MGRKVKEYRLKVKSFPSCSLMTPRRRGRLDLLSLIVLLSLLGTDGVLKKACGQISQGGTPYSFSSQTKSVSRTDTSTTPLSEDVPVIGMPKIRSSKIDSIKNANETQGPFQFAYGFQTDIEVKDSSVKDSLAAGMLYRTSIRSKGAFSLNLIFSKYHLPRGAKLFIYSKDQEDLIGAFTSNNNKKSKKLPTIPVEGDEVVVEYFEPYHPEFEGELKIGKVSHDFMDILNTQKGRGFGSSANCHVDVNCPEGDDWQDEKRAVLKLMKDGNSFCSGALLNNTAEDGTPYVLTAHHCICNSNEASESVFIFNYESPSCDGPNGSMVHSISGGFVVATNLESDFTLLQLSKKPLSTYDPYFAGWDRTDDQGSGGVGIHHPEGDVKKISTYTMEPQNSTCMGFSEDFGCGEEYLPNNNFYQVSWVSTQSGHSVPEHQSSGSPLFNNQDRIIGQNFGLGTCNVQGALCVNADEFETTYGKIHASWNGSSSNKRLRDWLNPSNNVSALDGISGCNEGTVDLHITHPISSGSSEHHLARSTITATNDVEDGAEATYEAGDRITLKEGFEAEEGSDLRARIVQTDQNCVVTCDPINVKSWTAQACSEGQLCFNVPYAEQYDIFMRRSILGPVALDIGGSVNGTSICFSLSSHDVDPGTYLAIVSFSNECQEVSNAYQMEVQNCKIGDSKDQGPEKKPDKTEEGLVDKGERSEGLDLAVHPNPNQGAFTVEIGPMIRSPYSFELIDSKGVVVHEVERLNSPRINVDRNKLPAGVYFIRIVMGMEQGTEKLIVRE